MSTTIRGKVYQPASNNFIRRHFWCGINALMKVRGAVRRDGAAWLPEGQTAIEYRSLQPSTLKSNALQLKKNPVAVCCNCQVGLADVVLQVRKVSVDSAPYLHMTCHLLGPTFIPSVAVIKASLSWEEKKNSNGNREKSFCSIFQAEDTTHRGL
jgi:hypothetical protein